MEITKSKPVTTTTTKNGAKKTLTLDFIKTILLYWLLTGLDTNIPTVNLNNLIIFFNLNNIKFKYKKSDSPQFTFERASFYILQQFPQ